MKLIAGFLISFLAGLMTWRRLQGGASSPLRLFSGAVLMTAALMLLTLLMPTSLASTVQEILGWCLAGSVAAVFLASVIGVLENLLDEA
ncbi:MAG: hypothetical protein Q7T87_09515 [Polaromonas sp.]|nr:hypothetical protein [Polaromonas sp.]